MRLCALSRGSKKKKSRRDLEMHSRLSRPPRPRARVRGLIRRNLGAPTSSPDARSARPLQCAKCAWHGRPRSSRICRVRHSKSPPWHGSQRPRREKRRSVQAFSSESLHGCRPRWAVLASTVLASPRGRVLLERPMVLCGRPITTRSRVGCHSLAHCCCSFSPASSCAWLRKS